MRYLIFILLLSACSSSNKNTERVSLTITEKAGELQGSEKVTTAECYCPEKKDATVISAVGSVVGNLISTIWD